MRILIISYLFYPGTSARAVRWSSLASYWGEQGHRVYVITAANLQNKSMDKKVKVIQVKENLLGRIRNIFENYSKQVVQADGDNQGSFFLLKALKSVIKILYKRVLRNIQWPDYAWTWRSNATSAAIDLLDNKDFDLMISVSHPFTSHLIAKKIKKKYPDLKWIADIGDPFYFLKESPLNNYLFYKHVNKKAEESILNLCDEISVTTSGTKKIYESLFSNLYEKTKVIPPLLSNDAADLFSSKKSKNIVGDSIKLSFIGTLYPSIRNPYFLLKALDFASEKVKKEIEVHFYGPVYNFSISSGEFKNISVSFHGNVSRSKALKEMLNTDILINLGNSTAFQLPSKVVEYLASGNKILNVISIRDDSSSKFFSHYSNCKTIFINENISENLLEELRSYLESFSLSDSDEGRNSNEWVEKYSVKNIAEKYEKLFS